MITVNIHKQGVASIMTIPVEVLKRLNIGIGSTLELSITKEGFMALPLSQKRYTLKELLQGATPENLKSLNKATKWAQQGESVGDELT